MYKINKHDDREFSDIDVEDILLQIRIQEDYHDFTPEEIFAECFKMHYAQFFPFETYTYEDRAIYRIELVKLLRVMSQNFEQQWSVGSKFTKTLIAELVEVED